MQDLVVAIVQTPLYWQDPVANRAMLEEKISGLRKVDVIVLPEMFTTAFSMNPAQFAENLFGDTFNWMTQKAKQFNAAITGSFICTENGKYYNRLIWMQPDGNYYKYDKRHLFTLAGENAHYTEGVERVTLEWRGWRICPLICYDLRFPVWSRNTFTKNNGVPTADYDVLIYVANWPEVRSYPWKQLLIARAIENQCYVIGVNRIGKDGNDISHSGDSMVINPRGEIISKTKANEGNIEVREIAPLPAM